MKYKISENCRLKCVISNLSIYLSIEEQHGRAFWGRLSSSLLPVASLSPYHPSTKDCCLINAVPSQTPRLLELSDWSSRYWSFYFPPRVTGFFLFVLADGNRIWFGTYRIHFPSSKAPAPAFFGWKLHLSKRYLKG